MVPDATSSPARNPLRQLWLALVEPHPAVVHPEERRRARLLSALLVILVPVSVFASIVAPLVSDPTANPFADPIQLQGLAVSLLGGVAYAVSRTRHHTLAATLAVLVAILGTWGTVLASAGTPHAAAAPYFLGLSVLIASIFLVWHYTLFLALLNIAGLLLLPRLDPGFAGFPIGDPLTFLIFHSAFIFMFAAVRHQDLKQIQQQSRTLQEEEERWRTLAENVPDIITQVDGDGRILFLNRAPSGAAKAQVLGKTLYDYTTPEDHEAIRRSMRRAFEAGLPDTYETRGAAPGAELRLYLNRIEPLRRDGVVTGATIISTDVTDQRRIEEERLKNLERAREIERLKEIAQLKTSFINTAAHELSTPLTPIMLQLHLLKARRDKMDESSRHAIEVLDRNVERLSVLLGDIMEGARLQASRLGIRRQSMDINKTVLEVVESFRAQAKTLSVRLETKLHPRLVVNADPARISQVLFNLLSNALKFTGAGGQVRVESDSEGGFAIVRVRDTGIGLTPPQIAKLFQPFSQVHDTMQTTRPGTGLGLYISRGIVELHEGRVWAESLGPNQGCTCAFAIPLGPEGP